MQERQLGVGMHLADPREVPGEEPILQRLGPDEVVLDREHLLGQGLLVLCDRGLQPGHGAGAGVTAQQEIKNGHEVALAGSEIAVQEDSAVLTRLQPERHEAERFIEGLGQGVCDHILGHGLGRLLNTFVQFQDEVAG